MQVKSELIQFLRVKISYDVVPNMQNFICLIIYSHGTCNNVKCKPLYVEIVTSIVSPENTVTHDSEIYRL